MRALNIGALIAAFSLCIFAQNEKLSANEIVKITNDAYARQRATSYRVSYSVEERFKVDSKERQVSFVEETERIPDGSFRSIRRTKDGDSATTVERVVVAGRRFVKTNDQPWVEEKGSVGGSGTGGPPGTTRDHSTTTKVKRNERINEVFVDHYQVTRHFVFDLKTGKTEVHDSVSSYWIDKSGSLIRTEIRRKKQTGNDSEEVHSRWDFEYDSKIKIEAPIK